MSPLRIIVLAALCYIFYRLLFAGKKRVRRGTRSGGAGFPSTQDVLVQDPVCHTYIPQKQAIRAVKDGKIYYFCSEKCCQNYLENKGDSK